MSRKLNTREKVMLTVLAVLFIGVVYYLLVYKPIMRNIAELNTQIEDLESKITVQQKLTATKKRMAAELETLKAGDNTESTPVAIYDNQTGVISFLNDTLRGVADYSLSFSQPGFDGSLVRRNVSLSFAARNYNEAVNIIRTLSDYPFRSRITNLSLMPQGNGLLSGPVSVGLSVVFYETTGA